MNWVTQSIHYEKAFVVIINYNEVWTTLRDVQRSHSYGSATHVIIVVFLTIIPSIVGKRNIAEVHVGSVMDTTTIQLATVT